jgi:hypothetical protein
MSVQSSTIVKERQYSPNSEIGDGRADDTKKRSRWLQPVLKVAGVAAFFVGIFPFLFICWLIVSTGANNVCVDYAAFLHVVDKVLSGQYQWLSIFSDSFIRTHLVLFPVLLHTAIAYVTHWDVTFELYIGMAIHVIRAFLIADLLANRISNRSTRLAVTGGVFALVFAMSQTCIMIYGEASIAIGLCLLGFTLALWSLCKFGRTPRGLALMVAGGILSSFSFGNVLPCWLTLLVAIFYLPARGWVQHWDVKYAGSHAGLNHGSRNHGMGLFVSRQVAVAYWLIGTVVSLTPYYYFLANRSSGNPELTKTFGIFDPVFVLNALGRPFARDMGLNYGRLPGAEISAVLLLVIVVALVMPIISSRMRICNATRISVLLFVYGFLSIWSVGVFRTHIAPWYASMSLYCWLAVFGVCAASLSRACNVDGSLTRRMRTALGTTAAAGIVAIVVLYLMTNVSYGDKQFFLNARAPVSGEYLREYPTAPTFLESTIFSNDGRPDRIVSFAGSLKKHELCVFSPNQTWALQGQFALDNVVVERASGSKRVIWLNGRSLRGAKSWRDYHHLNLLVPSGNVVEWRFKVPADAKEAVFNTSVSGYSEAAGKCATKPSKVVSTISVLSDAPYAVPDRAAAVARNNSQSSGGASYVTCCDNNWKPVRLNLLPYRGKPVTIRLGLSSQGDRYSGLCDDRDCIPSSVLFMYPHIDVVKEPAPKPKDSATTVVLSPSNTDLSPRFPNHYFQRFDLPALDSGAWKDMNMGLAADTSRAIPARYWTVLPTDGLVVDNFDYMMMQLEPLPGKEWCSLKMHLQFDDGTTDGFSMPLMPDNASHKYVYPVKLMTQRGGAKLVGVLAFASAIDSKDVPAKFKGKTLPATVATSSVPNQQADPGVPLGGCIRVSNLSFIKCGPTVAHAQMN